MKSSKQTLIWSVRAHLDAPEQTVLGTVHLQSKAVFFHLEQLLKRLAFADAVAVEYDLDQAERLLPEYLGNRNQEPWKTQLREEEYARYRRLVLKAFDVDLEQLQGLPPALVTNVLNEQQFPSDLPFKLDHWIWVWAKQHHKIRFGLGTMNEQRSILKLLDGPVGMRMLRKGLGNIRNLRVNADRLIELYRTGQIDALYRLSYASSGALRKAILLDRNHRMTEQIIEWGSNRPCFFAFGAAHLAGKYGVLALLKNQGWIVKPIAMRPNSPSFEIPHLP